MSLQSGTHRWVCVCDTLQYFTLTPGYNLAPASAKHTHTHTCMHLCIHTVFYMQSEEWPTAQLSNIPRCWIDGGKAEWSVVSEDNTIWERLFLERRERGREREREREREMEGGSNDCSAMTDRTTQTCTPHRHAHANGKLLSTLWLNVTFIIFSLSLSLALSLSLSLSLIPSSFLLLNPH